MKHEGCIQLSTPAESHIRHSTALSMIDTDRKEELVLKEGERQQIDGADKLDG